MSTTAPPAKIKAFVAGIKERLLSSSSSSSSPIVQLQYGILLMECLTRGVLPPSGISEKHNDNIPRIQQLLTSTAGKTLNDSLPKPLLAGVSVVQGMIAEQLASSIVDENNNNNNEPMVLSDDDGWTAVRRRCVDVEDERMRILLDLVMMPLSPPPPSTTTNGPKGSNSTTSTKTEEEYRRQRTEEVSSSWQQITYGSFLRGASQFSPDAPPLWKRAWDTATTATKRKEDMLDPLENLIRIASSKGNSKRVSELSLVLADAYLSSFHSKPSDVDNNKVERSSKHWKEVNMIFCDPYRSTNKQIDEDNYYYLKKAEVVLQSSNISATDQELLRYKVLMAQLVLDKEAFAMEALATSQYQAAKNRDLSLLSSFTSALDRYRATAKASFWKEQPPSDISNINSMLGNLMMHVLSSKADSDDDEKQWKEQAEDLLTYFVHRLLERAKVIQSAAAWKDTSSFCHAILSSSLSSMTDSSIALQTRLQGACLVASTTYLWISCETSCREPPWKDLLKVCSTIMADSILSLDDIQENASRRSLSSRGGVTEDQHQQYQWECARSTISSLMALSAGASSTTMLSAKQIDQSLTMVKKMPLVYQAQFGSIALTTWQAWNGLLSSSTPWTSCNVTQARALLKATRTCWESAKSDWGGRTPTLLGRLLLDVAEADAESILVGGFGARVAMLLYIKVQSLLPDLQGDDANAKELLEIYLLCGMARLTTNASDAEEKARKALDQLEKAKIDSESGIFLWSETSVMEAVKKKQRSLCRQLIANALVELGRALDAQEFLEAAVGEAPSDAEAAFSLGMFRLRMVLYSGDCSTADATEMKAAQTQLLKAAKLDSSRAGPFALLGIWYEVKGDTKRAIGCFSKALLLDSTNPVAGRGLLRLRSFTDVAKMCEVATNTNSSWNGWAWWATGKHKAMVEGDDELAVICYQEALRCRDVADSTGSSLSPIFFDLPDSVKNKGSKYDGGGEHSAVWVDLANSYRRLGRYTAAVRAYTSAWDLVSNTEHGYLSGLALSSWAQIVMELGLFDEAAEKFGLALEVAETGSSTATIAAYGQGTALLAIAQRDFQDGKAGAAYQHLKLAIDGMESTLSSADDDNSFGCPAKLLGDLYSFGGMLPPDVFISPSAPEPVVDRETLLKSQISFVGYGQKYYKQAESSLRQEEDDDTILIAVLACDSGANALFRAQLLSILHGEMSGFGINPSLVDTIASFPSVKEAFTEAESAFRRAIDLQPTYAPAWCGLGCCVVGCDPILAQHAFARSLQLDRTLPDAWSNLGFLYAAHDRHQASVDMMDALTQVADTPLMWICRAALLERKAAMGDSDERPALLRQAADAYRASLQVMKDPTALLGLSMTCRFASTTAQSNDENLFVAESTELERQESFGYMTEFMSASSGTNPGMSLIAKVMQVEDSVSKGRLDEGTLKLSSSTGSVPTQGGVSSFEESKLGAIAEAVDLTPDLADGEAAGPVETFNADKATAFMIGRSLMSDPQNPTVLLHVAKQAAMQLQIMKGVKKRKLVRQTLDTAMLTANRAAQVLDESFIGHPARYHYPCMPTRDNETKTSTSTPVPPPPLRSVVDSEQVADAVSLAYLVEQSAIEILASDEMKGEEAPPWMTASNDEENSSHRSHFNVQRAMMMNPESLLVREAFQLSVATLNDAENEI